MNLAAYKPTPRAKIRIDHFLENFGLRVRKAAQWPLSTSAMLHRGALRRFHAGEDGTGGIFFDVGAHVGETSMALAAAFPKVTIHAFEPVTRIYRQLVHNCRSLPTVTCHHLALGGENTTNRIALVSTNVDCTENQVSRPAGPDTPAELCDTITVSRLDDFCQQHDIKQIALLKTDTEGFELEVLRGAQRTLQEKRIASILIEVTFLRGNPQHVLFDDVRALLSPLGFDLTGFYDHGYRADTGQMWYTNALFTLS